MASTVLNGSGNFSYTNNTGQNVRVIIYGMSIVWGPTQTSPTLAQSFSITAGGSTFTIGLQAGVQNAAVWFGKGMAVGASNDASTPAYATGSNMLAYASNLDIVAAMPTEFVLSSGQTISSSGTPLANPPTVSYNMLVIPENG